MQQPGQQQRLCLRLSFAALRTVQNGGLAALAGHRRHQRMERALVRLQRIDMARVEREERTPVLQQNPCISGHNA
ncbi:hypothetical protein D3C73_1321910 [compost metagenome]